MRIPVIIALAAVAAGAAAPAASALVVDLSTYGRIATYDLPEPSGTSAPAGSLLAREVSAVTYNGDTDTLFVVGDGGTSIVQVSKTGAFIDSMTLPGGSSPQGTYFYDTEGLAYVGGGQFALVEERYRQLNLFTYAGGTTLDTATVQTVKLGTTIDNIGIEGATYDPTLDNFILVKEKGPQGIFETGVDFANGTASNGSPSSVNSTNLFDPNLLGLNDLSDVYAISNVDATNGNLLVLSQESGKLVNVDRMGNVNSELTIINSDPGNPLSVVNQGFEGVTLDNNGLLYLVAEAGGGDINHPQLWVYQAGAPQQVPLPGGGGGSVGANMRITEWLYSGAGGEYVEFTNVGDAVIDLSGWSYDDDSGVPGTFDLSGFGTVGAGESIIITESGCADFRLDWGLDAAVKCLGGYTNNIGRNDQINLFDADGNLIDRLTYGDQAFPGTIRTRNVSGRPGDLAALGADDPSLWESSAIGDIENSYASAAGEIGSPGYTSFNAIRSVPAPTGLPVAALGVATVFLTFRRRRVRAKAA